MMGDVVLWVLVLVVVVLALVVVVGVVRVVDGLVDVRVVGEGVVRELALARRSVERVGHQVVLSHEALLSANSTLITIREVLLASREELTQRSAESEASAFRGFTSVVEGLERISTLLDEKVPRLLQVPAPVAPAVTSSSDAPVTWADVRKLGAARRRREEQQRLAEEAARVKRMTEEAEALNARAPAPDYEFGRGVIDHLGEELETQPPDPKGVTGVEGEDGVREISNSRRTTTMDDILRQAREEEAKLT